MTNSRIEPQGDGADQHGAPGSSDSYARGGEGGTSSTSGDDVRSGAAASADADALGASMLDSDAALSGATPGDGSMQQELEMQRDKYLRLAAEYDNYRKRSIRERQDAGARSQADLVRQFLDALDDLARFAHVDPNSVDANTVVQGVEMVEKKLLKALTGAGLEIVDPTGQTFDPALHEAVGTEPAVALDDDHVVGRVYQPGYVFGGQLLRPARVVVKQWNG